MAAVRELARREKKTLSQVVNELLAEGTRRRRKRIRRPRLDLPSYAMGRPSVNLGDRDALEAAMEG